VIAISLHPLCDAQDRTIELESLMNGTHQLQNGTTTNIWGYRISDDEFPKPLELPSPYISLTEGDSVHIEMVNPSMEGHTIHLHGLDVDQANDGVPATSSFILTNDSGLYRFNADHPGNYIYHCHVTATLHVAMGMYGMIVVKPANDSMTVWNGGPSFTKEYSYLMSDMDRSWNDNYTTAGGFNTYVADQFLLNGKAGIQVYQDTNMTISAASSDTVLLRLANIGFSINRFTFPSALNATVVSSDGRPLTVAEQSDTLRIYPGERYSVLFTPPPGFQGYILVDHLHMYADEVLGLNSIPINTGVIYGIADASDDSPLFTVSPNPASDRIDLWISSAVRERSGLSMRFVMVNNTGEIVLSQSISRLQGSINIADLSAGAYYARLVIGTWESASVKLVKN
jgi:hypothetical protein